MQIYSRCFPASPASYNLWAAEKVAIFDALTLHLNSVSLFQFLMMFMGRRR